MWLYNLGIYLYWACVNIASLFINKAKLFTQGRKELLNKINNSIAPTDRVIWIHAASLGEFEQGRPVIESIKERYPNHKIMVTFFSPSGYEIKKNYTGADWIFYLPIDTPRNARRFLDAVKPEIAIFVKYEFWLNFLYQLRKRKIKTYIISSIFHPNAIFFRPYGTIFRKALSSFTHIFVQDKASLSLLSSIDVNNVTVAGDTRFDRVGVIVDNTKKLPILEDFAQGHNLFVAGSTWQPDEDILMRLINDYPDMKFVVAPHEMDASRIEAMINNANGSAIRYTLYDTNPHAKEQQLLIIDTIGILSSVYSYGNFAYIGGGFGVGIHNTLEAAAFGIPIAFGPNYYKFREARELIASGAASSITNYEELAAWLSQLRNNPEQYKAAANKAGKYVRSNRGATTIILDTITTH